MYLNPNSLEVDYFSQLYVDRIYKTPLFTTLYLFYGVST
ncbi:hypothetical protein CCAND95_490002 [Capnocytophaga canis]|uniref:Uncharacterized protein n=1 Tax=Capnocytophaga canis TaxID=1848903 RepID=A0A0B7IDF1_9FLAO|nr:hypothetical protein CCAN2_1510001 [Capnocytophaga canimorsus]CEN45159.1 hypothetical protein CCAND95_490002 [Capnocytophaga canis]CEN48008.1 hypothetical protein CCAND38_510013 [Capnocytophaga canis]